MNSTHPTCLRNYTDFLDANCVLVGPTSGCHFAGCLVYSRSRLQMSRFFKDCSVPSCSSCSQSPSQPSSSKHPWRSSSPTSCHDVLHTISHLLSRWLDSSIVNNSRRRPVVVCYKPRWRPFPLYLHTATASLTTAGSANKSSWYEWTKCSFVE